MHTLWTLLRCVAWSCFCGTIGALLVFLGVPLAAPLTIGLVLFAAVLFVWQVSMDAQGRPGPYLYMAAFAGLCLGSVIAASYVH